MWDNDLAVSFMVLLIIQVSIDNKEHMMIYVSFMMCKCKIGRFIIILCNHTNNQTKYATESMIDVLQAHI